MIGKVITFQFSIDQSLLGIYKVKMIFWSQSFDRVKFCIDSTRV